MLCPGGSVLCPSRVCVLMGYLRAAFQKLSLIGLLAFLSGFCSETGPLLLHNLIINYYFKKNCLDGMQHSLFLNCLKPDVVFLCVEECIFFSS